MKIQNNNEGIRMAGIDQNIKNIYVVIGRAGTWRRGGWEPDYQRTEDTLVKLITADSLARAKAIARSAGYDPEETREWCVRKASKNQIEWAKFALESDWIQ